MIHATEVKQSRQPLPCISPPYRGIAKMFFQFVLASFAKIYTLRRSV